MPSRRHPALLFIRNAHHVCFEPVAPLLHARAHHRQVIGVIVNAAAGVTLRVLLDQIAREPVHASVTSARLPCAAQIARLKRLAARQASGFSASTSQR